MSTSKQEQESGIKNPNPKIVLFLCRWCSGKGADLAGTSRLNYPPNVLPIMVNCTSRIDPRFIVEAFLDGADGVLVTGCHFGDCHYKTGNYKAYRRLSLVAKLLKQVGVNPKRFRLTWISATEATKFVKVTTEMVEDLKKLPPYWSDENGGNSDE
ncbi:MAG: hydrogenase iron-sulfur subunit [Candidatus Heimdallarchaeaceae archaeon]|nr:MAG: methyl-viologen-reducing hydrogenase subunit delta [Candidatus Pacearchaeota archaeon]